MTRRPSHAALVLGALALGVLAVLALAGTAAPVRAQACPPYCATPVITPAWHMHMCDMSYQEQLVDNHCMFGPGVTEFPAGTDKVYAIYCHQYASTVQVFIKDAGGGMQYVNHPDGLTYSGDGCESLLWSRAGGIPSAGSPYFTSAWWPEGPFSGVGVGIEWYIGLFVAFDQDNYYGSSAEAIITARDPAANLDPTKLDTITVRVTSTSDPVGIDVVLREEAPGFPVFKDPRGLHFSPIASNQAQGVIKVSNRDTITVTYCPRNCQRPYVDTATWYQLDATITPTPLPTWSGPPPTATSTPPPNLRVEYITLRPAPADVGYVPQISTNSGRPNHLGYASVYAGMWTHGTNAHFGMVQFDLSPLPEGARIIDARLEMVGRESRFTEPGAWAVRLLDPSIDDGWRNASYENLRTTAVLAQIGPTLGQTDIAVARPNSFGFAPSQMGLVDVRLHTTRRISFRVDGPGGEDNNLFGWESGVDVYHRERTPPDPSLGPALHLAYAPEGVPSSPSPPTPTGPTPTRVPGSSTPPPGTAAPTPGATSIGPTPPFGSPSSTPVGPTPPTAGPSSTPSGGGTPPTPGGTAPTPGGTPPTPGGTAPTPGGTAPTPGGTAPTPGGTVPTPGGTAPTPGPSSTPGVGPTPGEGTSPATATSATGVPGDTPTPTGPAVQRTVCVLGFDDLDGDGGRDPLERFLAGMSVKLTHRPSGAFVSWTTDGANDPDYCWSGLTDGPYSLAVSALPVGYTSTGFPERQFDVPFPGPPARFEFGARRPDAPSATPSASPTPGPTGTPPPTATPTAQPTVTGPSGEVCLSVFEDRDGNGFHDASEARLPDVRMFIRDDAGNILRELLSRADASVCSRLRVGIYRARRSEVPGATGTTEDEQVVLLTEGARQDVDFGVRLRARGDRLFVPLAMTGNARRH